MRNYDEKSVVASLKRIGCTFSTENSISPNGKTIVTNVINKPANLGIHQLGKIHYLVHYCGYTTLSKVSKDTSKEDAKEDNEVHKKTRRGNKKLSDSTMAAIDYLASNIF